MTTILFLSTKAWVILASVVLIIGFIKALMQPSRRTKYDDDFGNPDTILSRYNKGFAVDGTRRLSLEDSYRNFFVQGGVGSGKSTCIAIPYLKLADGVSLIVNDNSGELLEASYPDLIKKGYRIRVLRFRDPANSVAYNPIERANTVGEINKVAQVIVNTALGTKSNDQFWSQSAITLISLFILVLKRQPKEFHNLYNLRYLLELFNSKSTARLIDELFVKMDDATYSSYRSFMGYGDKTLAGVVATCLASLSLLQDIDVARVTSVDTIGDFSDLRKTKQVIFIQNVVTDLVYLRFVVDLLYGQLFEFLLSRPYQKGELPIMFVLDEFGSSMKIPNAAAVFSTLRKTKSGLLVINQSAAQLVSTYSASEAEILLSNCYTKLYLSGGLDLSTASQLERRGGKFEFEDEKGVHRVRELMTASEILQIPKETGLLDVGNLPIMKLGLTPYYRKFSFGSKPSVPLELVGEVPETVSLLQLKLKQK